MTIETDLVVVGAGIAGLTAANRAAALGCRVVVLETGADDRYFCNSRIATGVLNVATTCATAGIIVGVVTLTGLAQRFADIIIGYAQGSLLLTTIFTAAI